VILVNSLFVRSRIRNSLIRLFAFFSFHLEHKISLIINYMQNKLINLQINYFFIVYKKLITNILFNK